jgi:hypothetical protein
MKNKALFLICVLLSSYIYAQASFGKINDNNVRMRESNTIDSNILTQLQKNQSVEIIQTIDSDDKDFIDYKWIKVKTDNKIGYVYGKYVDPQISTNKLKWQDVKLKVNNKFIYIGMQKNELFKLLGSPKKIFHDDSDNTDTLNYEEYSGLTIIITSYNNRIDHLIISNPEFIFNCGLKCGNKFDSNMLKISANKINNKTIVISNIDYGFLSHLYEGIIICTLDTSGIITEIQFGLEEM